MPSIKPVAEDEAMDNKNKQPPLKITDRIQLIHSNGSSPYTHQLQLPIYTGGEHS